LLLWEKQPGDHVRVRVKRKEIDVTLEAAAKPVAAARE